MKKYIYITLVLLLSIITKVNAEEITIKSIEVKDRTEEVSYSDPIYNDLNVNLDSSFIDKDDYITYKIVLENTSNKDYIIKESNNFTNSNYVSYTYDSGNNIIKSNKDKEIYLTFKYNNLFDNKYTENNKLVLELIKDEDSNLINASTGIGFKILIIVLLMVLSFYILYKYIKNKKIPKISLFIIILLIPMIVIAKTSYILTINTNISYDIDIKTLDNLGLSVDTSHTPDFTTVSGNSGVDSEDDSKNNLGDGTNGIYKSEDDLGKSYYFRGDVQNNNVCFANKPWQIIRINGDGTIRMIYNGTIGKTAYNTNYDDNTYVGYMYGTKGTSTYAETHKNTNNSTIKTYIDNWYNTNLSSYSQYIADAIYCNDREVVNTSVTDDGETMEVNGNGTGITQTAYTSLKRNFVDHSPTLKCRQANDKFTISNTLGNGALTYPVGLPTTDEVVMAGGYVYDIPNNKYIRNEKYYLYPNGYRYWTMTPDSFIASGSAGYAFVDGVYGGNVGINRVGNADRAARPVVSLKSNSVTGGDGTKNYPFTVGGSTCTIPEQSGGSSRELS